MKRILMGFLWLVIVLLLEKETVSAQETNDYQITVETTAEVTTTGKMQVTDRWEITNLSAAKYLAEFGYEINGEAKNVKSSDEKIAVVATKKEGGQSSIMISFAAPAVGEKKSQSFEISYELNNTELINNDPLLMIVTEPEIITMGEIDDKKLVMQLGEGIENEIDLGSGKKMYGNTQQRFLVIGQTSKKNEANNSVNVEVLLADANSGKKTTLVDIAPLPQKIKEMRDGKMVASWLLKGQETMTINYREIWEIEMLDWWPHWRELENYMVTGENNGQIEMQLLHSNDKIEVNEEILEITRENEYEQRRKAKEILVMAGSIGAVAAIPGGLLVFFRRKRSAICRQSKKPTQSAEQL